MSRRVSVIFLSSCKWTQNIFPTKAGQVNNPFFFLNKWFQAWIQEAVLI